MKTPERIFLHKDIKTFMADMMWATEKSDVWFVHEYISVEYLKNLLKQTFEKMDKLDKASKEYADLYHFGYNLKNVLKFLDLNE